MILKKAPPIPWKVCHFWRMKYSLTFQTVQLAGFELLAEIFLSVSVLVTKMTLTSSASPAEMLKYIILGREFTLAFLLGKHEGLY